MVRKTLIHGFHQVELHPNCRDIINFLSQKGLFCYKRLSFGVNAAPEKYQYIIRQVIADVDGVVNIADDVVIHGKTLAEHDQNLHKLLAELENMNLILNGGKCTFGLNKVVFVEILFSEHDIGPTEGKARAVKGATRTT